MQANVALDEAEAEGVGYSKVKADSEIWPDLLPQPRLPGKQSLLGWKPEGQGGFSDCFRHSSFKYARIALCSLRALGKIPSRRCLLQSYEQALVHLSIRTILRL